MSKTKNENKVRKGDYGYLVSEKKKRILITAILFAVPLGIFFSAMIYFKTRLTIWTVIAVVGCLPACKSMVSLIMIFRAKPVAPQVYEEISEHAGRILMSYEMYMTFYEKKWHRSMHLRSVEIRLSVSAVIRRSMLHLWSGKHRRFCGEMALRQTSRSLRGCRSFWNVWIP